MPEITLEPTGAFAQIDTALMQQSIDLLTNSSDTLKAARIRDIRKRSEKYAPPVLFVLSNVLFDQGERDEAAFWFYAGQLRGRFDANRCADESAGQGITTLGQTYGPAINQYMFEDLPKLQQTVREVIKWDEETPYEYDHRWINLHGVQAYAASMGSTSDDSIVMSKPEEEWEQIAQETRDTYLQGFQQALGQFKAQQGETASQGKASDEAMWRVDDRVFAYYEDDEYWYPATISAVDGDAISVSFDDDEGDETEVTADDIDSLEVAVGDDVEVYDEDDDDYYEATVLAVSGEKVKVRYVPEDEDEEEGEEAWTTLDALRIA